MQVIKLDDRIIYRADAGKKVRFVNDKIKYSEIVVGYDNTREVEEVDANE